MRTDAAPLVPRAHLDALADAGLYAITDAPIPVWYEVIEALASGCLTTAFVWIQHFGAAWRLAAAGRPLAGRAGIAIGAVTRPGPARLRAVERDGGWVLDGSADWVTGWGLIDVLLTAARTDDGRVVWTLVDARASDTLAVRPLRLIAANASGTVELSFRDHVARDVIDVRPYAAPPGHDGGGRPNGSLALGVARRCCELIGPCPLDDELAQRRAQLDAADDRSMADARAAASELAIRAATVLTVTRGSRALLQTDHAQRLAREALFTLVFGTRPAIRASLLERVRAP